MSRTTVYTGSYVHSVSLTELEYVENAVICIVEGVIAWIEKDVTVHQLQDIAVKHGLDLEGGAVDVVELEADEFFSPGFIDTHTHAPQYPNNGIGYGVPLLDWLDTITFPTEKQFKDVSHAQEVYSRVVQTTLNAGTTTACYYGTLHLPSTRALVDICTHKGQRAMIGKCSMDRNSPEYYVESTSSGIDTVNAFVESFPHLLSRNAAGSSDRATIETNGVNGALKDTTFPLVQPILTPRMAISCTPELLQHISDTAHSFDPPLAIQTHLSENHKEIETTLELFPHCETYTAVYDHFKLLTRGTILAHCVHLTKEERKMIKQREAGVSHCPSSNFFIQSGCARVREMLDDGINVGLGSDCSGGYSHSLLPIIRLTTQVSQQHAWADSSNSFNPLSVAEAFYLATMGGATLCRLEDKVGNFVPGKEFDALRIKIKSPGAWVKRGDKIQDRFSKWLWCGDDRDIKEVYVRGRKVGGASAI